MLYNLTCLTIMGLFCTLASYSWGKWEPGPHAHRSQQNAAKTVLIWKDAKAETLARVYAVSHDEVNEPISIFTARRQQ